MADQHTYLYLDVATSDPSGAQSLLAKYGYSGISSIQSIKDLASALQLMVAQNGTNALLDVADLHPDRELFFALYERDNAASANASASTSGSDSNTNSVQQLLAAHNITTQQTHTFLVIVGVLFAGAILLKYTHHHG